MSNIERLHAELEQLSGENVELRGRLAALDWLIAPTSDTTLNERIQTDGDQVGAAIEILGPLGERVITLVTVHDRIKRGG